MTSRTVSTTVTTTSTVSLGEAAPGRVGRWAVQIEDVSGTWEVAPKSKSVANGDLTATAVSFFDVVAGAMATTAPTASGTILIDSTGQAVELAVTVTSGSMKIAATSVEG